MNINDLPHELLEEIFSYFIQEYNERTVSDELPKLAAVCKKFNKVIQNSTRLMKGLTIFWKEEGRDAKALLASTRKYHNIVFMKTTKTSPCLAKFLEQQPCIKYLDFWEGTFSTFTFWTIINLVKDTLEHLDLYNVKFTDDGDLIPIRLSNLKTLGLFHDVPKERILSLFELPLNLKKFEYSNDGKRDTDLSDEGFAAYRNILINSIHLKTLSVSGKAFISKIFSDSILAERAKFQLERLEVKFDSPSTSQLSNFSSFLNHQSSLKELELTKFVVTHESLKSILSIRTLKELSIEASTFQISREMHIKSTSIEVLNIRNEWIDDPTKEPPSNTLEYEIGICEIVKACPSVHKIDLSDYHVTKTISEAIVKHLKKLETLELFLPWKMCPISFPTVSNMIIIDTFKDETIVQWLIDLVKLNPQLKNLKITDTIFLETNFLEAVKELNLSNLKIKYR